MVCCCARSVSPSRCALCDSAAAKALAERFGLAPSGGSDYHGLRKPDIALGSGRGGLRVPYAYLAGLKALAGHERV